jgi:hypothetical protein
MNTHLQEGLIPGIFRRSFAVLAMAALALGAAAVGRAQAPSGGEKSPPKASAPAAQNAVPVARVSSPAPTAEKGLSTGIQVHGHWVIEVKNPDGTVTARREFENAIQPPGMSYLASLLAGGNSPGQLSILLDGGGSSFKVGNPSGPEASPALVVLAPVIAGEGPCNAWGPVGIGPFSLASQGTCVITAAANASGYASVFGSGCLAAQQAASASGTRPPCSTSLTATAPASLSFTYFGGPPIPQTTLSGSVLASSPSGGNINDVETVFETCFPGETAVGCLTSYSLGTGSWQAGLSPGGVGMNLFTLKNLDGIGTDPQPVPYNTGQTIAVTVTFSFQ